MSKYIGGEKMIFAKDEYDIHYAKVREAFCCSDIKLLECQFLYELLGFFDYMQKNCNSILDDIENRTVPDNINLPIEIIDYLNSYELPKSRLNEIRRECEKGFEGIASRLWKGLSLVSGVSNRSYLTEKSALERYISGISQHHLCYCASECYIGTPIDIDSYEYVMMPQNAFFEFLPYPSEKGKTLLPHELKVGGLYEPVITNFSGFYRYKMSDVVKITGYVGESPKMEFMFRKGQAINIAGEKYDIRQLEKAVYSLREYGMYAENYCAFGSMEKIPERYIVTLALQNDISLPEEQVAAIIDSSLCKYNSEYDDLRKTKGLGRPVVFLCSVNIFTEASAYQYGR